jgi:ornithine carbamoyltransferase
MKRDLLSIKDLQVEEIEHIFSLTHDLKGKVKDFSASLAGKSLGLIFLKPSLRTRVSFDVGMSQLGGHTLYLAPEDIKFGTRESIKDFAYTISRYLHVLVIRTFAHKQLEELAKYASIPVINGLTDLLHPCQAFADLYTIKEKKGSLAGVNLAYIGDGNNVAHSLLYGCAKLGVNLKLAVPPKHQPSKDVLSEALRLAKTTNARIVLSDAVQEAAEGADIIYTDVWASMGQESESKKRKKDFSRFQVNQKLVALAKPDCLIMPCLPAHRGEEITHDVIDGPQSVVFDQAENSRRAGYILLRCLA